MIKLENIFEQNFNTKKEVFEFLASNIAKDDTEFKQEIIEGLNKREEEVSTGFEDGIAIPHAQVSKIAEPIVAIVRTKGINWPSMDKLDTTFIICIITPKNGSDQHLKILANMTRKLAQKEFRDAIKLAKPEEIKTLFMDTVPLKEEESKKDRAKFFVAVTKCPVGIAHTYLAAEKLERAAQSLGYEIKVETQGSSGIENKITMDDVKRAKGVIIAADAAIDNKSRFNGKKTIEVKIKDSLNNSEKLLKDVENAKELNIETKDVIEENPTIMKAIMNGVSHMIPFVVLGGLLIALSLSIGGVPTAEGLVIPEDSIWMSINQIGVIGFTLMIPILAGYIAYAIAGRAALAPAMIGAMIANDPSILRTEAGTGFLGALAVGIIVGYLVNWMNSWKIKKELKPIMPIFIIPILGTLIISGIFIFLLAAPINWLMSTLNNTLTYLASNSALTILLGMSLGAMVAVDMGGPINKVAFLFGVASITSGHPEIMGAVAAAIAVPPLGMGLATLIAKNKFTEEEKGAGIAALLMGLIGITEGAIPFAAADPKKVIPSIIVGSMVSSTLALLFGITNMVPHGGPIVGILGATTNTFLYFIAIAIGSCVTAILAVSIKNNIK